MVRLHGREVDYGRRIDGQDCSSVDPVGRTHCVVDRYPDAGISDSRSGSVKVAHHLDMMVVQVQFLPRLPLPSSISGKCTPLISARQSVQLGSGGPEKGKAVEVLALFGMLVVIGGVYFALRDQGAVKPQDRTCTCPTRASGTLWFTVKR